MIARGHYPEPLNLGSSSMISISELVSLIEEIAGIKLQRKYIPGHLGVRGRNSDNTLIQREFGWQPSKPLRDGLAATYAWVRDQVAADLGTRRLQLSLSR
jgi:GDP-D-mannose 3', 5'-epimerase